MTGQSSDLDWRGMVPVSKRFDDPYYSLDDGAAETSHVFLDGNDLPARFRDGFHIAELGFGTGLNLLVALDAFRRSEVSGRLHFTSFEAFPLAAEDIAKAHAAFPALAEIAEELALRWYKDDGRIELEDLSFTLVCGDARQTLAQTTLRADAWFLDGFSPARNPELWEVDLLGEVAAKTVPGGTCATYTAAGHVRRALQDAGFDVTRVPGYGRKRHMTVGTLR